MRYKIKRCKMISYKAHEFMIKQMISKKVIEKALHAKYKKMGDDDEIKNKGKGKWNKNKKKDQRKNDERAMVKEQEINVEEFIP